MITKIAPAIEYITMSVANSVFFIIFLVVLLRGFLGLYQDYLNKKQTGKWSFAWFNAFDLKLPKKEVKK